MKKLNIIMMVCVLAISLIGCGNKAADKSEGKELEGSCADILETVYKNADLDQELKDAMDSYENTAINSDNAEYILGTKDIKYTDSVYSAPMMNAIAYQCVVLRVDKDQDVEAAKKLLSDKADPRKWICVEAESVIVENKGDVILFIMADQATADAVKEAFFAL